MENPLKNPMEKGWVWTALACGNQAQVEVGGIFAMPWRCSSTKTLSVDGGFNPIGSGSHGFAKASPIAASMLSFDYVHVKMKNKTYLS